MFGWGKKPVDAAQLNARNPLCAEAFNPIFYMAFEGERGFNDQFLTKLSKDYDKHYAVSKLARKRGKHEQLKKTILSVSIELLSTNASDASISVSQYAVRFGRTNALGSIGDIVFGFAPGLALQGPSEAHNIAKSMIQDLQARLSGAGPNT
jgi:hypothetical protein